MVQRENASSKELILAFVLIVATTQKTKAFYFVNFSPNFYVKSISRIFSPKFRALCRREQGHIPGSRCCGGGELLLSLGLGGVGGLWGYSA